MAESLIHVGLIDDPIVVARETLEGPEFRELVQDITLHGLEIPVIVRRLGGRVRVVDGYRRFKAAQAAGLTEIRCDPRDLTDDEEVALLMRVGLHRKDFTPLEEGRVFAALEEGAGYSVEGIAHQVGKSPAYVAARLEIVRAPEDVQAAVADGLLTFSVGRELARCAHPEDRKFLLYHATHGGCTTELMRSWVQKAAADRALLPATADPAAPVVAQDVRPQLLGVCSVHEGEVPIESLLHQQICLACWSAIMSAARRGAAARETREEVSDAGPTP